mgnify:CR=1 FL=1
MWCDKWMLKAQNIGWFQIFIPCGCWENSLPGYREIGKLLGKMKKDFESFCFDYRIVLPILWSQSQTMPGWYEYDLVDILPIG